MQRQHDSEPLCAQSLCKRVRFTPYPGSSSDKHNTAIAQAACNTHVTEPCGALRLSSQPILLWCIDDMAREVVALAYWPFSQALARLVLRVLDTPQGRYHCDLVGVLIALACGRRLTRPQRATVARLTPTQLFDVAELGPLRLVTFANQVTVPADVPCDAEPPIEDADLSPMLYKQICFSRFCDECDYETRRNAL